MASKKKNQKAEEIEITKVVQLENQIKYLKSELRDAKDNILNSNKMLEFVHGCKQTTFNTKPTWLTIKRKRRNLTGIPVLFLSDIHFDEVVNPRQIENLNKYNREIASERILHTFRTAVKFCTEYMKDPKYDGIVCALGGDLLSGNIHEELSETNEAPILESSMYLSELLIQGISSLADAFGNVFVPCVVGNHGRLHRKPRAKNRVQDNYEWMVYHNIARHFKEDKRITFLIPEGADAQFEIYDKKFLLTHGDQFRGGSGIAGIFSPLMLGSHRKQRRTPFDIMMLGHWHQYIHTQSLIVNGCFTPNTPVIMSDGTPRAISEVSIGDKVLSRTGTYEVNHVFEKQFDGHLTCLRMGSAYSDIKCTPNHEIFAIKGQQLESKRPQGGRSVVKGDYCPEAKWIPAEFLSPGDYVQIGQIENEVDDASKLAEVLNVEYKNSGKETFNTVEFEGRKYVKVTHIWRERYNGPVYDLEVDSDHSYTVNGITVHNSIKGYDEYAYVSNFPWENPQQALFIVHPTYGVTFRMPIVCNSYEFKDQSKMEGIKIWKA